VVGIEDLAGGGQILADARPLAPRQTDQRFDEVTHYRRLSRHRRHQPQLPELRLRLGKALLAHSRSLDLLVEFIQIGTFLAFAEFLLDRLDLLVEVILALTLLHLALDASPNALFNLQDVDLSLELREQAFDTRAHIKHFEDFLLLLQFQGQVCGNGIGQTPGVLDAGDRGQNFRWNLLVELDVLVELRDHRAAQRLDFVVGAIIGNHWACACKEHLVTRVDGLQARSLRAFDQDLHGPVR
jgi:hypothetical protein